MSNDALNTKEPTMSLARRDQIRKVAAAIAVGLHNDLGSLPRAALELLAQVDSLESELAEIKVENARLQKAATDAIALAASRMSPKTYHELLVENETLRSELARKAADRV